MSMRKNLIFFRIGGFGTFISCQEGQFNWESNRISPSCLELEEINKKKRE